MVPVEDLIEQRFDGLAKEVRQGFARLDKKIDREVARVEKKIDQGLARVEKRVDDGFERVDADVRELRRDRTLGQRALLRVCVALLVFIGVTIQLLVAFAA